MTDRIPNDDVLFDRLADGELSSAERRALLASLDELPDGWRRCALTLLEAQAWRREFSSLVHDVPTSSPAAVTPESISNETPPEAGRGRPAAPSRRSVRPERWATLAASLLLAFGMGWKYHALREASSGGALTPTQVADSNGEAPFALDPAAQPDLQQSRDAVTLVVRDVNGQNRRLQLPLVEVATGDRIGGSELFPTELREGLHNRGLDVRSKRRYAPFFFEQGKQLVPMAVPVDDTYVVPVKRPVY